MMSRLPAEIRTDRLLLRVPVGDDALPLNQAIHASHAELHAWMDWAVEPQKLEDTEKFCRESQSAWQAETTLNCLLIELDSGEIVGSSGYPRLDWSVPRFEIGYWCRSDRVGRGYVSEAAWALARHAFEVLGANRVEVRMDDRNIRSWRVAERLGFSLEATLRNDLRAPDGTLRDTRIYGATSLDSLRPFVRR